MEDKLTGNVTIPLDRYEDLREKEKIYLDKKEISDLLHSRELQLMTALEAIGFLVDWLDGKFPSMPSRMLLEQLNRLGVIENISRDRVRSFSIKDPEK